MNESRYEVKIVEKPNGANLPLPRGDEGINVRAYEIRAIPPGSTDLLQAALDHLKTLAPGPNRDEASRIIDEEVLPIALSMIAKGYGYRLVVDFHLELDPAYFKPGSGESAHA